ncbi:SelB C-terminal domain-containing protein [Mycolicibacillus trivialis]
MSGYVEGGHVVATAGHVDHGKTTLVAALTGMQPDRWAEERRRGLTLDLGFAWTRLPSGREVAFVDVPGHQRFLANTLAGLGPAPVVSFVVAADEGWCAQSGDHRDAIAALGIEHGLLVISHADRAPDRAGEVLTQARAELAETGLADAPAVVVSAVTGAGLDDLRSTLDRLLADLPAPAAEGRLRLWIDRSFTITGAGTVVTGTLAAGTLRRGDRLHLCGPDGDHPVEVRGLQRCGRSHSVVAPTARVAVNLRGRPADGIHRGHALLTPDAWPLTRVVDVRRCGGGALTDAPAGITVYAGTAAVPARLRPLGPDHARLTLDRALPLVFGDRVVLRAPGAPHLIGGARVLDAEPPAFARRGAGARRAAVLAALPPDGDVAGEVARRGAVRAAHLRRLGLTGEPGPQVAEVDGWWVDIASRRGWRRRLVEAVEENRQRNPLAPGLSRGAACDLLGLPDATLLDTVLAGTGLQHSGGHIRAPGHGDLGPAEPAIAALEARLATTPFQAPEAHDLAELRLGVRELAAAEGAGRLLRVGDGVVLLPTAPALAMRRLAALPQPFTTSTARRALETSRRVAIPLLEHLDARGWTRRTDPAHREVVR